MLTDADAVYLDWGTADAAGDPPRRARGAVGHSLRRRARWGRRSRRPAGSCATGKRAAIGELAELSRIIAGEAGTTIDPAASGIVYAR